MENAHKLRSQIESTGTHLCNTPVVESEREEDFVPTRFQRFTWVVNGRYFARNFLNATTHSYLLI